MAWPHPGNDKLKDVLSQQEVVCTNAIEEADRDPTGGVAIFPSEPATLIGSANLSGGDLYKGGQEIRWAIFGCVDYTYGNRKHGQTGFNFVLGKNIAGMVRGLPFVEGKPIDIEPPSEDLIKGGFPKDAPKEASIPASEAWFMPADSGNYAK
jgi:hypothetical protein